MVKGSKLNIFRQNHMCHGIHDRAILNPVTRWYRKYLKIIEQVGISYKRLHKLRMPVQQIHPVKCEAILLVKLFHRVEWLLLQLFRVATITTMEHTIPP